MKEYFVNVPVTTAFNIKVQANSKEEAIEKALTTPVTLQILNDPKSDIIFADDYQMHRIIYDGTIFHGVLNEIEIED